MKKEIFLGMLAVVAIITIGVVSPAIADYASEVNADSPTTWYRFESVYNLASPFVKDEVDGRTADVAGAKRTVGLIGNAMSFDGVDDVITTSGLVTPDHPSFTVEIWAKSAAPTWDGGFLYAWRAGSGQVGYVFDCADASDDLDVYVGGGAVQVGLISPVDIDQWHHYALTHNDTTGDSILYVDGVSTATASGNIAGRFETFVTVHIGMDPSVVDDPDRYFNGLLDEYAVYDTVLGADRILAHYNAGIALAAPVPIVKLDFADPNDMLTTNLGSLGGTQQMRLGVNDETILPPTLTDSSPSYHQEQDQSYGFYSSYTTPEMTEMTMAFWVRPHLTNLYRVIVASDSAAGSPTVAPTPSFFAAINSADATTGNLWLGGAGGGMIQILNAFTADTWTHVAISYDSAGPTANVYIDGVLTPPYTSTAPWSGTVAAAPAGMVITPHNVAGGFAGFNGHVDNLHVYDTALTQGQIKGLMMLNVAVELTIPTVCDEVATGLMLAADLNCDCYVDLRDFAVIADPNDWLAPCVDPENESCDKPWL